MSLETAQPAEPDSSAPSGQERKLNKLPFGGILDIFEWGFVMGLLASLLGLGWALWEGRHVIMILAWSIEVLVAATIVVFFFARFRHFPKIYILLMWLYVLMYAILDVKEGIIAGGLVALLWTLYFLCSDRVRRTFYPSALEAEFNQPVPGAVANARDQLLAEIKAQEGCWSDSCEMPLQQFAESMKQAGFKRSRMISELTQAGIDYRVAKKLSR